MKFKTGKPPRKRSDKPRLTIADLPPLDKVTHCSMKDTSIYTGLSLPIVYGLVKTGVLVTHVIGGRRFTATDSVKRLTTGKAQAPKRRPKFVPIRNVPRAAA